MPYVMVPVPAEHEEEFAQWLLGVTLRAKLSDWPPGAAAELVAGTDAVVRAALEVIAGGGEYYIPASEVAEAIGADEDSLLTGLAELAQRSAERSCPPLVMVRTEADADGRTVSSLLMNASTRTQVHEALRSS